jgi:hypothetical protein
MGIVIKHSDGKQINYLRSNNSYLPIPNLIGELNAENNIGIYNFDKAGDLEKTARNDHFHFSIKDHQRNLEDFLRDIRKPEGFLEYIPQVKPLRSEEVQFMKDWVLNHFDSKEKPIQDKSIHREPKKKFIRAPKSLFLYTPEEEIFKDDTIRPVSDILMNYGVHRIKRTVGTYDTSGIYAKRVVDFFEERGMEGTKVLGQGGYSLAVDMGNETVLKITTEMKKDFGNRFFDADILEIGEIPEVKTFYYIQEKADVKVSELDHKHFSEIVNENGYWFWDGHITKEQIGYDADGNIILIDYGAVEEKGTKNDHDYESKKAKREASKSLGKIPFIDFSKHFSVCFGDEADFKNE